METMTPENKPVTDQTAPALREEPAVPAKKAPELKLPKSKKKHRWLKVLVILAVIAAAVAVLAIRARNSIKSQVSDNYLVETAERRDLTVSVTGTATLQPADSYNVNTLVSGEIQHAPFEEGDSVKKDDLLFSIDASTAQNSLSSAAISVQEAQLNYQQAVEAMNPTATQAGTIDEVYVKNGSSVTAGTALCRILSSTDLYVDFLYDADVAKNFHIGQNVEVYITGFDGSTPGTITSISSASFLTTTGRDMCTVRVKLSNPGTVADNRTGYAIVAGNSSYGTTKISYTGTSTVYATGAGTVTNFTKLPGSKVTQGEVLCTLSSDSLRAQLKSAQLAIDSAKLGVNSAENSISDYSIRSPISGTVIEKNFKAGDTVQGMNSGTLAVVYDLSYLKLEMNVDELDISKVQVGQSVQITADALSGQTFTGTVNKVSINGTTTNGVTTYPVTIIIEDYGSLLPGMNVSAKILGETAKNVLCIPLDAVSRGDVVLVPKAGAMNADNTGVVDPSKLEEKEIALGRNDENYIEVTSGLAEGDTVLILNQASNAMQTMMGG